MYSMKRKFLFVTLSLLLCLGGSLLQARAETPQSKRDDSENIRKALHALLPLFKTCACCGREDSADQIVRLEERLDGLSREELASVAQSFDVPRFTALVDKLKAATAASEGEASALAPLKSPLEPPNYEGSCPPPRRPVKFFFGFISVIAVLEEAENASAIVCETGLSVPFEGIGTPACVGALFIESVAIVGRTILTALLLCEAAIDAAEIEAAWKNTVNIHDDLAASGAKVDQRFNALEQRINGIGAQLQKLLDNPEITLHGKKAADVSAGD